MTLIDKSNLSVLYLDMGRYKAAETIGQEVLATRLKTLGSKNSYMSSSLDHLVRYWSALNRFREGKPLLKQALTIRAKLVPGTAFQCRKLHASPEQSLREDRESHTSEAFEERALDLATRAV